jgi:hypothetical protein
MLSRARSSGRRHRDRREPRHRLRDLAILVGVGFILNGIGSPCLASACAGLGGTPRSQADGGRGEVPLRRPP